MNKNTPAGRHSSHDARKARQRGITYYSETVPPSRGNYRPARFDVTDGYVGITQATACPSTGDRVLLSPAQYAALVRFVGGSR